MKHGEYTELILQKIYKIIQDTDLTVDNPKILSADFQAGFEYGKGEFIRRIKDSEL